MDLLILAAGMGSRFGGPKQFEPIDCHDNFIVDYSIYDAIKAGFDRIVLLTRKEYKELAESTLKARWRNKVKFDIVFQSTDYTQKKFGIERQKPLGTGNAILETSEYIHDNFCIINADDFYGAKSFNVAAEYLKHVDKQSSNFALVGYNLKNTLSESGAVKRGICKEQKGYVIDIIESKVEKVGNEVHSTEVETGKQYIVPLDSIVSMNMICFTPEIYKYLKNQFEIFCKDMENLKSGEFLIPTAVHELTQKGLATLKLLNTNEKWIGMTYKEDKPIVVNGLRELVEKGIYPEILNQ